MRCPNCGHNLTKVALKSIEVDHCDFCGGTLFESNEINRVSTQEAEMLAEQKQSDVISGQEKVSPRDGSVLTRMNGDSIPQFVTLLKSETSGEVFAFADDLVAFKKAQKAKINYFKVWQIPLPALQNVLVLSLLIAITAGSIILSQSLLTPQTQTSQADQLCKGGVMVSSTPESFLFSCETAVEMTCRVASMCNGDSVDKVLSDTPTRIHVGTVAKDCSSIKLECSDGQTSFETEWEGL